MWQNLSAISDKYSAKIVVPQNGDSDESVCVDGGSDEVVGVLSCITQWVIAYVSKVKEPVVCKDLWGIATSLCGE